MQHLSFSHTMHDVQIYDLHHFPWLSLEVRLVPHFGCGVSCTQAVQGGCFPSVGNLVEKSWHLLVPGAAGQDAWDKPSLRNLRAFPSWSTKHTHAHAHAHAHAHTVWRIGNHNFSLETCRMLKKQSMRWMNEFWKSVKRKKPSENHQKARDACKCTSTQCGTRGALPWPSFFLRPYTAQFAQYFLKALKLLLYLIIMLPNPSQLVSVPPKELPIPTFLCTSAEMRPLSRVELPTQAQVRYGSKSDTEVQPDEDNNIGTMRWQFFPWGADPLPINALTKPSTLTKVLPWTSVSPWKNILSTFMRRENLSHEVTRAISPGRTTEKSHGVKLSSCDKGGNGTWEMGYT